MFRKLLLTMSLLLVAGIAYAEFKIEYSATALSVPLVTTVYTKSFPIKSNTANYIGVAYRNAATATGSTVIAFQQSFQRPTTEQSSDSTYLDTEAWTLSTDATWRQATVDTVVMPYGRFRITGTGQNPATTKVDIVVSKE
jgi:hypothetical protein